MTRRIRRRPARACHRERTSDDYPLRRSGKSASLSCGNIDDGDGPVLSICDPNFPAVGGEVESFSTSTGGDVSYPPGLPWITRRRASRQTASGRRRSRWRARGGGGTLFEEA